MKPGSVAWFTYWDNKLSLDCPITKERAFQIPLPHSLPLCPWGGHFTRGGFQCGRPHLHGRSPYWCVSEWVKIQDMHYISAGLLPFFAIRWIPNLPYHTLLFLKYMNNNELFLRRHKRRGPEDFESIIMLFWNKSCKSVLPLPSLPRCT